MTAPSLFRRVTKYCPTSALDPRENRLTEVTAAVVAEVPLFAVRMGALLLDKEAGDLNFTDVEVQTQIVTPSGRFVDLELRLFDQANNQTALLWVEVKHGSGLSGDQLDAYTTDIQSRKPGEFNERRIVLLVSRGWDLEHESPGTIPVRYWQDVTALAKEVLNNEDLEPQHRWLLDQYVRFLEEEGMTDPEPLTPETAESLMLIGKAENSMSGLCALADRRVQQWGTRTQAKQSRGNSSTAAYGTGFWAHYEPKSDGVTNLLPAEGAWLEWSLKNTSSAEYLDSPSGAWAFFAGITFLKRENLEQFESDEEKRALASNLTLNRIWIDGYYRLNAFLYPTEVSHLPTIEEQGDFVGSWIVNIFDSFFGTATGDTRL